MKKLISMILAICMLSFSLFALSGCLQGAGTQDPTQNQTPDPDEEKKEKYINGTDISKYAIVYSDEDSDYSFRAAEYIKNKINEYTKIDIPLIEDNENGEGGYEIVVGETSRPVSAALNAETEGLEFSMLCEDKSIALEGDYFIIAAAAYYFVETYIAPNESEITVPTGVSVHEPIVKEAKNHILLIGDGMGVYQTKLFEYMNSKLDISDGENLFYGYMLPYEGRSMTNSLSGLTDSAAAGTAMACGEKTYNEYVGRDKDNKDIKSLTELALELGKAAAVMSTEDSTGATPAAFSSHTDNRDNSSEIFDDQAVLEYDLGAIINCLTFGSDSYEENNIETLESEILETLAELEKNENGFFLMYEEAYIDKHSHSNDILKTYKAVVRFNQAIGIFMEYAFYNPETCIIITADHETGGLAPNASRSLSYSTDGHTDANVPIFTYGDGGELFDGKQIENTQIAHTIASFWGVTDFGDQSTVGYLK